MKINPGERWEEEEDKNKCTNTHTIPHGEFTSETSTRFSRSRKRVCGSIKTDRAPRQHTGSQVSYRSGMVQK